MMASSVTDRPWTHPGLARWWRALLAFLLVPGMFLALGAASFVPHDTSVQTWYSGASDQTWTYTGNAITSTNTGICTLSMPSGGCLTFNHAGGGSGTATSPNVALSASGTIKYYLEADCAATGAPITAADITLAVTGAATATGLAFTDASGVCTSAQFSAPTSSGNVQLVISQASASETDSLTNIVLWSTQPTFTGGGGSGSLGFPSLDLTAISDNIGLFFSFMSPLLWILLGIGVAGIILARARNFV